jgi:hypothetical protein
MPPDGRVDSTRPPSAGKVAIAAQGMEISSARGAPETSGEVIWVTLPSAVLAWGHRMVEVVCFTGSNGTTAHNNKPRMPATVATNRGIRCDR